MIQLTADNFDEEVKEGKTLIDFGRLGADLVACNLPSWNSSKQAAQP